MGHNKLKGRVIGLTGNIACGKSTAARYLRDLGFAVIDADAISREIMQPGSAVAEKLKQEFGTVDRQKLRDQVFGNPQKRKRLEAITHPAIQQRSQQLIKERFKAGAKTVIYEASLLCETGRTQEFDGILVITCPEQMQLKRVQARDASLSAETARQIIQAQMTQAEKSKLATWVIDNAGTPDQLKDAIAHWARETLGKRSSGS